MADIVYLPQHCGAVAHIPHNLDGDPSEPAARRLLYLRGMHEGFEKGFVAGREFGQPAPLWRRLLNDVRGLRALASSYLPTWWDLVMGLIVAFSLTSTLVLAIVVRALVP